MNFQEAKKILRLSRKPGALIQLEDGEWDINFSNKKDSDLIPFIKKEKIKWRGHVIKAKDKKLLDNLEAEMKNLKDLLSSNNEAIKQIKEEQIYNPFISGDSYEEAMDSIKRFEQRNTDISKKIFEIGKRISNHYI
jgi:hypothetical protein